jgi:DNA-binding GntR family transcriptional regulator
VAVSGEFQSPGSLVEEAVRVITDRIVRGDLPPGTRLVEERLAADFGISRPPIRESFRVLEREGLVTISPRRGVWVRRFTPEEVRDIYLCRAVLRGLAARLAAQHMTPHLLQQLESALQVMERAAASGDAEQYQHDVSHFNALVVQFSGNLPLQELLRTLTLRARMLSFAALSFPDRLQASLALHQSMLEAFRRGDAQTAERCSQQTLEESIPYVMAYMREHPASVA